MDFYLVAILDKEGKIFTIEIDDNKTIKELSGEHFSRFYTDEEQEQGVPERDLEKAKSEEVNKTMNALDISGKTFSASLSLEAVEDQRSEVSRFLFTIRRQDLISEHNEEMYEFNKLVVHDLRNVLNVADGYLGIARESRDFEDFEKVKQAHKDMLGIIEDILALRKGKNIPKKELSLKKVFEQAFKYSSDNNTTYVAEEATVKAGRASLIRIFSNLIINSIEHNDKQIHIKVGPLTDKEGFYYEDNGKGILEEEREKVFRKNYSPSKDDGGLGLFIVDRIAEFNGWEVELKESEAGGARFEMYEK